MRSSKSERSHGRQGRGEPAGRAAGGVPPGCERRADVLTAGRALQARGVLVRDAGAPELVGRQGYGCEYFLYHKSKSSFLCIGELRCRVDNESWLCQPRLQPWRESKCVRQRGEMHALQHATCTTLITCGAAYSFLIDKCGAIRTDVHCSIMKHANST